MADPDKQGGKSTGAMLSIGELTESAGEIARVTAVAADIVVRGTLEVIAIVDEFAENEDLPNTTNPDDWARISGKKGGSSTSARWSPASRRAHRGPSIRDTRKLAGGEQQPEHE